MKTVFEYGGPNTYVGAKSKSLIQLYQSEKGRFLFTLVYGLEVHSGVKYGEACDLLGAAILHDACCDGIASNEGA